MYLTVCFLILMCARAPKPSLSLSFRPLSSFPISSALCFSFAGRTDTGTLMHGRLTCTFYLLFIFTYAAKNCV